jgi:hypothetical protein
MVEQHYCGDVLVDYSFFGKAKSCGMEIPLQASDSHEHNLEKKDCCDDVTLSITGQQDLKLSFDKLNFEQQQFIVSFVYSYLNLFEGLEENIVPFNHYPAPLLVRDIHTLDQTFLI